jgi:WD40 repeat protein/serine/threonine protein kinase
MAPSTIGRYQIKSELGRGGMASVYYGYDPRFKRDVAIKVLPREFLHDPMFQARFQREAETIAALEHPAIVPVYDFGEEDGQPYLVMRYMPGGSLADRLKGGPLPLEDAARVIERLASALDEAHAGGIIHRDLKPGNILFDQRNDPFLSDFGIVKLSEQASESDLTGGGVVGTPAYMSPEQARAELELDGRSDVYALGAILFEMLAGHQPFRAETPIGLIVKHLSDPVPSILASRPGLPDGIQQVLYKALAKNRDQRYQTAGELALAVSTVLHTQPSNEVPDSTLPIPPASVSPAPDDPSTMPAIGGAVPATYKHQEEATLKRQGGVTSPAAGARRLPSTWLLITGGILGIVVLAALISLILASQGYPGLFSSLSLDAASPASGPTATLSAASFAGPIPDGAKARLGKGTLNTIALSPDGKHVAVGGGVGVYLYDSQSFEQLWIGQTGSPVSSLAFSPDGRTLAAGLDNGNLLLLDPADGKLIRDATPHSDTVTGLAWSPDSKRLATASADSTLRLIDTDGVHSLTGHTARVFCLAFSPDGKYLLSGSEDKTALLQDVETGESRTLVAHSDGVFGVAFSPDSKTAVTASLDGKMIAWDVASASQVGDFKGPGDGLVSVAFSPDGTLIASGSSSGALLIWDAAQRTQVASLSGHSGWIASLAWMPNGGEIFSGSFDNTVMAWDVARGQLLRTLRGHTDWVTAVTFGPQIATGSARGEVILWNAETDQPQTLPSGHTDQVNGLAFSPDGTRLASASRDKSVIVWDVGSARKVSVLTGHPGPVTAAVFSPDGTRLGTASCADPVADAGCTRGQIRLWNTDTGQLASDPLVGHANLITALAWVPGSTTLLSGSADGTLIAWNTATGKSGITFEGHTSAVNSVAVSSDGKLVASGANDSTVIVWNAATGNILHTLSGHTRDVRSVAFSPDGKWLASGADDRMVMVWNTATGEKVAQLSGHNGSVRGIAWSPDGKLILSGSTDGTAILWNLPGDALTGLESNRKFLEMVEGCLLLSWVG